jgi:X-X-X-Leu-X-X-Gly heptad repeat protein
MKYIYLCLGIISVYFFAAISVRMSHIELLLEDSNEQKQQTLTSNQAVIEANKQVASGLKELSAKVQQISDSLTRK